MHTHRLVEKKKCVKNTYVRYYILCDFITDKLSVLRGYILVLYVDTNN